MKSARALSFDRSLPALALTAMVAVPAMPAQAEWDPLIIMPQHMGLENSLGWEASQRPYYIDIVSPSWYIAQGDGSIARRPEIVGDSLISYVNAAHNLGMKVMPMVQNDSLCLLADPDALDNAVSNLLSLAVNFTYDGYLLDFEKLNSLTKAGYKQLVEDLYDGLSAAGRKLYIAVGATNHHGGWDYPTLSQNSDGLYVMFYDYAGPWSTTAGPTAPLNKITNHLDAIIAQGVAADNLIMGMPFYGNDFTVTGGNQVIDTTTLYMDGITQLQQTWSATEQWDATSQTPFFTYNDGQSHQVWYENAKSYRQKFKLALNEGLQGVGAWSLRYTDRDAAAAFWPVYESLTSHVDAGDRWYMTSDTTVTRASTTPGDAIDLTVDNGSGLERIGANFDTLQLDDAGDRIGLKFDMKRLTGGSISDSTGFRFGLYNNGGTPITADSTSGVLQNTTDDTGYFIELGVGAAGATASREGAESNGILAGPRTYNVALGSGSGAGFAGFNDTDLHEVTLLLTRLTNGIHLIIEVDGVAVIDVSDTTSGYVTDLNIVAFGIREVAYDYWLGNVRVNAYTVPNPEPASSMLLAAGMLVLTTRPTRGLRRRSRHC